MNRSQNTARRHADHLVRCFMSGVAMFATMATIADAADPAKVARPAGRPASGGRPTTAATVVDPAVQPAGGMVCQQCGPGGCHHTRHGHHRDCRDGACVPYCPVRPGTFGYYGTQWRRWPGQGVVPVSNVEAASPVKPPKSEVPGADEESLGPKPSELPEPSAGDDNAATPMPPEPAASPDALPAEAQPSAPEPREAEPAPAKPATGDLFDQSAAPKVRRRILAQAAAGPQAASEESAVRTTAHESTPRATEVPTRPTRTVPRVAFDPRTESARLREAR